MSLLIKSGIVLLLVWSAGTLLVHGANELAQDMKQTNESRLTSFEVK